jgi:hypothetical protein
MTKCSWTVLGAALALLLPAAGVFPVPGGEEEASWTGSVPEDLRRPRRGEAPRYPQDMIIGDLGAGEAPEEAYAFSRELLAALTAENRNAPVLSGLGGAPLDELFSKLKPIGPRQYRIGGGREENDGSVSFLVRFLGREQGIAGELYLRPGEGRWLLDDLLLEEPADLMREREQYRYDFSPYERFY